MWELHVERLRASDYDLVQPLLVDLYAAEQPHYTDHPQLSREDLERFVHGIPTGFAGENVILAVRDRNGGLAGFCWCVLFDPGTGLEGEVAEVFVAEAHRRTGVGRALVDEAVRLFIERGVTLAYVWTRGENEAAVRLYEQAGFTPNRQLVMTWYPAGDAGDPARGAE
jgi:ribosomal protein S18 acetylase RimI-like enzyme